MQVMLLGSRPSLLSCKIADRDPQRPRHARAVCRVRSHAVLHMALLDVRPCITHRAGGILEQRLPLRRSHLAEQIARLLPMVVIHAMVPMRPVAVHRHRRLGEIGLIVPEPGAVGVEGERAAEIAVRPHLPVAMIAAIRAFRRVHRNMVEVDAKPVALRVAVGEQPRLQHLVGREADPRHDVGRREGRLLHFGKVVVRIAVQLHHADLDQRIVFLRPDLGKIEGVVPVRLRLRLRHHLDEERPAREIVAIDRGQQIAAIAFAVLGNDSCSLGVGQVLDPLLRAEMEFDPDALIGRVDHREGVAAEEVHVAEALRDAAVGHDDRHLVQRFGQQGPEIPVVVGAAQPGARVALDRVVEVGEAQRIAEEEHRRVVADDVPVACGWLQTYLANPDTSIDHFERALRLSPFDPMNFNACIGIGAAHFVAGRYADTAVWIEKGLIDRPGATWAYRELVAAYALLGRDADARAGLARLLKEYRDLTVSKVLSALVYSQPTLDRIAEGLRKAGFPEE
jgi:tetratricopeptide (TPR) repeat protein